MWLGFRRLPTCTRRLGPDPPRTMPERGHRRRRPVSDRSPPNRQRRSNETDGLQNRIQDDVNQCYFGFYDDPQKRLGAAFAHIRTTDPQLVKLLCVWPSLPIPGRNVITALATSFSKQEGLAIPLRVLLRASCVSQTGRPQVSAKQTSTSVSKSASWWHTFSSIRLQPPVAGRAHVATDRRRESHSIVTQGKIGGALDPKNAAFANLTKEPTRLL